MKNLEIVKEVKLHFNTEIIVLWNAKEKAFDYYFKDMFMDNFDFSFGCADLFSDEQLQNMEYNGYFIRFMIGYANAILRTLEGKTDIPEKYRNEFRKEVDAVLYLYKHGMTTRYDAMRTLSEYDNKINRFNMFYNVN